MANILYGINGEGSGHSTRSKEVITHLINSGHKVTVATSGRGLNLNKYFPVEEIFGFNFVYTKGRVNEFRSFFENLDVFPGATKSLRKLSGLIHNKKIDLIITDFEPITSYLSNVRRIPAISINNQHFISRTKAVCPKHYRTQANLTKAGIELMTPGAEAYLVLSFFEAKVKDKKTFIVPPILRREVLDLKPSEGDYVLIYLTHGFENLTQLLRGVSARFTVYGSNEDQQEGNITFKKFSEEAFLKDLAGAGAVFATAGFSLISEALHLGKPFLAWPVDNQFEQVFNAYHLDRLGYGKWIKDPSREAIEGFLSDLPAYRKKLSRYPRRDNQLLFSKLDQLMIDLL